MLTLQIAAGILLGGWGLIATAAAFIALKEKLDTNKRYGRPWWRGIFLVPR